MLIKSTIFEDTSPVYKRVLPAGTVHNKEDIIHYYILVSESLANVFKAMGVSVFEHKSKITNESQYEVRIRPDKTLAEDEFLEKNDMRIDLKTVSGFRGQTLLYFGRNGIWPGYYKEHENE